MPTVPSEQTIRAVCETLSTFYANQNLSLLETQLRQKKTSVRYALSAVTYLGSNRLGALLLFCVASFVYPRRWFVSNEQDYYVLSLSKNNEIAISRLLAALEHTVGSSVGLNNRKLSFAERIRIFRYPSYWSMATKAFLKHRNSSALSQLNIALALSILPLFFANLTKANSKTLVVANDHSPAAVAAVNSAHQLGIEVCYVQHGSVTRAFPPLNYSIALLQNDFSRECYLSIDSKYKTKVALFPCFETPFKITRSLPLNPTICIALSFFPNLISLRELITQLNELFPRSKISLKQHPRCNIDLSQIGCEMDVSILSRDIATDFLAHQIDLAIVANSSVTVEFLHFGCPVIYWPHGDTGPRDYYGFLGSGIVPEISGDLLQNPDQISGFFDENWRSRFARFDPLVNQTYEELVAQAMCWFKDRTPPK